jgi:Fe-S cluster biosynthesis and repair protein YggX
MPTLEQRITQFENMAGADPDNEMAHFSLGSVYLEAERLAEAAQSFSRCIELNPDMSKAYQLAGQSMIGAGWTDQAVQVLTKGYEVAASKGDMMPRDAIAQLLESIGREAPSLSSEHEAAAQRLQSSGTFICQRTGSPGTQLEGPPFRGPLGVWIQENISQETWQTWIGQGTKVINELRLDLSREEDQRTYDQHMCEFLGLAPAEYEQMSAT